MDNTGWQIFNKKNKERKKKWYEELREQRTRDYMS
jgi:hypothetical protein